MKQERIDMSKVCIVLVCIILAVLAIIAIIFAVEIISNKNSRSTYNELNQTDRRMIETVNSYFESKAEELGEVAIPTGSITGSDEVTGSDQASSDEVTGSDQAEQPAIKHGKLTKPIAFVRQDGIARGRAFVFNVPLTENKLDYGLNGGTFSAEIILPEDIDLPTLYRCSRFAPKLGSYLFPVDYQIKELCGKDIIVICYNSASLDDGTFLTLLDRAFADMNK